MGKKFDFDSNPVSEAFRAGNQARKKESAADTVESVSNTITFKELWDLFNTPEIKYSFETMLEDLIAKHGLNLETGRPDIHRQLGYRHLNLYRDNERICEFYWNNEYKGNNRRLTWLYMVPQDSTIAGCALCLIKNSADIKLYADAVIRLKQVLLGEHGDDFANEAFRAGNRARKKEAAVDAVQDVNLHTITFEELKDAFCVENLRDHVIDSIKAVTDKHDLGIEFEGGFPREFGIIKNGKTVGWLKWRGSAGRLEWLTLVPVDNTIEECTLCQVSCIGPAKVYVSSIDMLRLVLLGLHGDSLDEAFKAGNKARKKEAVQDAVQDVEIVQMPDWSGTPHEIFEDMHGILMDIDLSTKRISTDDSIYNQEFTVHGKKKPFESFSAAVFDAGCTIDFYLEDDIITMTALPIGSGVMTLFSPSPGYRKTHRPYIESNMGHPQWKVDPELWTELLSWIDKHEVLK